MKAWFPYAWKETGMGGLGSGVYSQAFYDLIGNPWYAYTPAFNVGRSVEVTAPALGGAAQAVSAVSVLPGNLGVGALSLTGLMNPNPPANNSVGSP